MMTKHTRGVRSLALFASMSLCVSWAQAQVALKGKVTSEDKKPLGFAAVRLLDGSGKLITGGSTGVDGAYTLKNVAKGTYTLEVSFVGYVTHKGKIEVKQSSGDQTLPSVTLKEDAKSLKEVSVTAKATEIAVKGDTIEYNAGTFAQTDGAMLEELIKKLPGAEVDESGNITINGKQVTNILVDGKRFFQTDTKVALKNLPAEVIDKVQVYDRASQAAQLTGFSDGDDETVLNLTIKAGRKQGLFGTAYVGGGTDERYEANASINRFADDTQWSVIGGMNNTNNAGFSDISSDVSQSGLPGGGGARGVRRGGPGRNTQNDGITTSKVLGGNYVNANQKESELGVSGMYGNSDKKQLTNTRTQNVLSSGSTTEDGKVSEQNDKDNFGVNLRWQWKPSERTQIILTPRINYGIGKGEYLSKYATTNDQTGSQLNETTLRQSTDNRNLDSRLDVDVSQRLNDKGRTLALSLSGGYTQDETDGAYYNQLQNYSTGANTLVDQVLDYTKKGVNYRARLSYVEPLGQNYFLQLQYQFKGEHSSSDKAAYDQDPLTGQYTSLNNLYSSTYNSDFYSHQAGVALKKKGNKYEITAGFNLNPSTLKSYAERSGTSREITQNTLNYSPTLRFSYKPSKAFDLNVDYRGRSFQPTIDQLMPIADVTNPLVTIVGNENLTPGYTHNLFARLGSFDAKAQSALMVFMHLQYVQDDIVSRTSYDLSSGVRTTTYTNEDGNARVGLGGFYNRPIFGKKLSLRINSRNIYSRQVGFVDNQKNIANSFNLDEAIGLNYRNSFIDATLTGGWNLYTVNNSLESVSGETTRDYRIEFEPIATFPLGFKVEGKVRYTTSSGYSSDFSQDQTVIDLGLSYSFLSNKALTIRLKAYDLLNQKRNIYRSVSALTTTTEETNTLGRYAMLHLIYRFSSFSANASAADMKAMPGRGPAGSPPGRF